MTNLTERIEGIYLCAREKSQLSLFHWKIRY